METTITTATYVFTNSKVNYAILLNDNFNDSSNVRHIPTLRKDKNGNYTNSCYIGVNVNNKIVTFKLNRQLTDNERDTIIALKENGNDNQKTTTRQPRQRKNVGAMGGNYGKYNDIISFLKAHDNKTIDTDTQNALITIYNWLASDNVNVQKAVLLLQREHFTLNTFRTYVRQLQDNESMQDNGMHLYERKFLQERQERDNALQQAKELQERQQQEYDNQLAKLLAIGMDTDTAEKLARQLADIVK